LKGEETWKTNTTAQSNITFVTKTSDIINFSQIIRPYVETSEVAFSCVARVWDARGNPWIWHPRSP